MDLFILEEQNNSPIVDILKTQYAVLLRIRKVRHSQQEDLFLNNPLCTFKVILQGLANFPSLNPAE